MIMKEKRRKGRGTNNVPLMLIALPGLIYLLINNYIPMFGIFLAFKSYDFSKGIFKSPWCGFDNFKFLFKTKDALIMTRNTILYNLAFIVIGTALGILVAILLTEIVSSVWAKFYQAALLLPYLLSWVVISYMVFAFLNSDSGFINNTILKAFGMSPVSWYTKSEVWPILLIVVFLWQTVGHTSIIYMASIAGIDKGIYEAAKIDGAGKIKQIFCITLPLLKPTVIIMVLMAIGKIFFSDFGLFYQVPMNSGALYGVTQTIDTFVYRGLMELNDVGMSSAAGLFQSCVGFILVVTANALVRKIDPDNALF